MNGARNGVPRAGLTRAGYLAGLTGLATALTVLLGWWGCLLAGALAGFALGRRCGPLLLPSTLAGSAAWALVLLVADFAFGEGARAAQALGAVLGIGAAGAIAATLLFAGLTTGLAAAVARGVREALHSGVAPPRSPGGERR